MGNIRITFTSRELDEMINTLLEIVSLAWVVLCVVVVLFLHITFYTDQTNIYVLIRLELKVLVGGFYYFWSDPGYLFPSVYSPLTKCKFNQLLAAASHF